MSNDIWYLNMNDPLNFKNSLTMLEESRRMRALIIGIDGGAWYVLQNVLPHTKTLNNMIKEGSYGTLKSTIPPVTLPAWPSMITGYNPAKHGVVGFTDKYLKGKSFRDLKKPTFWEILGYKGYKSLIVNVPATYPPRPFNGILIPGMGMPNNKILTYPEDIQKYLQEINYIVEAPLDVVRRLSTSTTALNELLKVEEQHTDVFLDLSAKEHFDLGFIVFRATDIAQHMIWTQKSKIFEVYKRIDNLINKLIKEIDPDLVLIVSDHGFKDYNQAFSVSKYLEERGLIKYKTVQNTHYHSQSQNRFSLIFLLSNIIKKMNIDSEKVPYVLLQALRKIVPSGIREILSPPKEIDTNRSIAYAHWYHFGVCINERLVEDYEGFREELIFELQNLKDCSGRPIFKWVKKREDVYAGEYIDLLPDILFEPYEWIFIGGSKWAKKTIEKYYSYQHDVNGIIVAYGDDVKNGVKIAAMIYDIAPTILHIFGLPIPEDMDGKPILEIFKEDSKLGKTQPLYVNWTFYEKDVKAVKRVASKLSNELSKTKNE